MMNQRGIAIAWVYALAGVGVVIAGLGVAVKVQTERLHASQAKIAEVQAAFDVFKARAKREAEIAQAEQDAREAADKARQERTNAENAKAKADLAAEFARYRKLRQPRVSTNTDYVRQAPAASKRPDIACYPRAPFADAIRTINERFQRAGVSLDGLLEPVEVRDGAVVDLNSAKAWAQSGAK